MMSTGSSEVEMTNVTSKIKIVDAPNAKEGDMVIDEQAILNLQETTVASNSVSDPTSSLATDSLSPENLALHSDILKVILISTYLLRNKLIFVMSIFFSLQRNIPLTFI
jgi:hypothetical protein